MVLLDPVAPLDLMTPVKSVALSKPLVTFNPLVSLCSALH